MKKTIHSESELPILAKEILKFAKETKVFLFNGNLGTGKTTFIKQLCKELGVKGQTSSPTYSIVNEYLVENAKIYHIDLYRLNSVEEAFEVGLEDYLYSDNYCFIEWPEVANELFPNDFISISIEKTSETERIFEVIKQETL